MIDNPQAFPCLDSSSGGLSMRDPGMTLWDYFAGQALPAVVVQCAGDSINPAGTRADERVTRPAYFAKVAGEIADAMLAERAKRFAITVGAGVDAVDSPTSCQHDDTPWTP